jgi:hypothetical protein
MIYIFISKAAPCTPIRVYARFSLLLQAVQKGHLITWPGLTEDAINKHLKMMPVTAMGHMNQKRQNIHSTKNEVTYDFEDKAITPVSLGAKTHLVYAVIIYLGQLYTYLTGIFVLRLIKGNSSFHIHFLHRSIFRVRLDHPCLLPHRSNH